MLLKTGDVIQKRGGDKYQVLGFSLTDDKNHCDCVYTKRIKDSEEIFINVDTVKEYYIKIKQKFYVGQKVVHDGKDCKIIYIESETHCVIDDLHDLEYKRVELAELKLKSTVYIYRDGTGKLQATQNQSLENIIGEAEILE